MSPVWLLEHMPLNSHVDRFFSVMQLRTGVTMVQTEGYAALMSGVSATVARGLFYGGVLPLLFAT